ncbi:MULTISPECIES: hypothetical protein [Burkholderia]|uniref:Uncharacterized protein n=1 Tax=Burkholderia contaminans TaxID=488447 RepID=A0A2S5DRI3_9BURK|nr:MULTISPECIES: hypothetical protein [Burkholderia]EKS9794864.1 hypothetical protein [Burkholderia cepacia]EKS9802819.1 hypothetical protein [Burkholderia cepacia]EKS9809326.1 hypothetical protein [Burkholderia cepacia]EKS9818187.1 hypothetical protein [Burkholderia cepacia]EKS9831337.1 hypothetical protein [Burkholderia cepacia]
MASDDEIKQAEARAYQRGYAAGQRKRKSDRQRQHEARERQAFRDRAFLATLPVALAAQGWTRSGKSISSIEDRVRLAWGFTNEALKQRGEV